MRKKPIPVLASMVSLSFFSGLLPAIADDSQVKIFEKDLQTFVGRFGTENEDYPRQLSVLASIYLQNGKLTQSKNSFDKAIIFAKKLRQPESVILEIVPARTSDLASVDITEARKVLSLGLDAANKLPFADQRRLDFLFSTIGFYKQIGRKDEEQAQVKLLDEQLNAIEKAQDLNEEYRAAAGASLVKMAGLYCPGPPWNVEKKEFPVIHIVADSQTPRKNQVTSGAFKKSEEYQLRAIRQFDKTSLQSRINAYRSLALWYRFYGQSNTAQIQVQILGKLVNSLDESILFPKYQCEGCGKG